MVDTNRPGQPSLFTCINTPQNLQSRSRVNPRTHKTGRFLTPFRFSIGYPKDDIPTHRDTKILLFTGKQIISEEIGLSFNFLDLQQKIMDETYR